MVFILNLVEFSFWFDFDGKVGEILLRNPLLSIDKFTIIHKA